MVAYFVVPGAGAWVLLAGLGGLLVTVGAFLDGRARRLKYATASS